MDACEKYQGLLMGLIDCELNPDEAKEVYDHLVRCASCRQAYDELKAASNKMESILPHQPSDEELESLWRAPYSRWTRLSGLILIMAGWIVLIGYIVFQYVVRGETPLLPRLAAVAVIIGFLVLLISLIRERIIKYKSDPYREVTR